MILVTVNHFCRADMVEKASARIDANGDRMATLPGFLFRYRMTARNDPLMMSTVTAWADEASYDAWRDIRNTGNEGWMFEGESPYKNAVSQVHFVDKVHGEVIK